MNTTTADKIKTAALREGEDNKSYIASKLVNARKDRAFEEIKQNIFAPGHVSVYIVSIYDNPVSLKDFQALKPEIRATRGCYTIRYLPMADKKRNPKFPYLIGQDLVRIRVTVSGPSHWHTLCSRIPELGWLRRNSTFSDALFGIAKKHPGLLIRFGIDFAKYCDKIEKKAEELGIDIDHKPLVMYQWGSKDAPQIDGKLNPIKTKADYLNEIEAAQNESRGEENICL